MSGLVLPVSDRDHVRGPAEAPVTLVEYGDFECPYCGRAYEDLQTIERDMGPRLRVVFREFPLTSVHPHAEAAALAAEAAGVQGKFWEMHDMLFEMQDSLDGESLWEYAGVLGLDLEEFDREMESRRLLSRVKEDFRSGVRSGVSGTPGFFINGERYLGPPGGPELLQALRGAAEARPPR